MESGVPLKWMDLSPQERLTSQKILMGTDAWIARNINKRISLPISIHLARWGVTPNQITTFNILLGILAAAVASQGGYLHFLMGGLLFQLVSIIDGCDGEVAKLNDCSTRFGSLFDTIGDNLSFVLFIVGVTLGLYQDTHADWIVWASKTSIIAFAALLAIMISYLIRQRSETVSLVKYEREVVSTNFQEGIPAKLVCFGKFLVKKDFFAFLFFLLAALNLPQGIVFFAALGTSSVAIILCTLEIKRVVAGKKAAFDDEVLP